MVKEKHILALEEALVAVKRDSDDDGELMQLLSEIDAIVEAGTGVRWQDIDPIPPLAKSLARLLLQIELGVVINPMYQASVISRMKQLQIEAVKIVERLSEQESASRQLSIKE